MFTYGAWAGSGAIAPLCTNHPVASQLNMHHNMLRLVIPLALLGVAIPKAAAQSTSWVEDPDVLTRAYVAWAGPGSYYTEDIALRPGQQPLRFSMGSNCFFVVEVRVVSPYVGSWETIHDTSDQACLFGSVRWPGVPTGTGPYRIEMRYRGLSGSWRDFTYDLIVAPNAQRAFRDANYNEMVLWTGTTSALDSPLLLVEGIDAQGLINPSLYYVLGLPLFTAARARGADMLVMNFRDGGADMRLNAGVVQDAIRYLNGIRTGPRRLDVVGHSMGGVVARYALAKMEENGTPHDVQRFVSLDAPHQSAIVDLDLQVYVRDQVPQQHWPANLTSAAGRQLLLNNLFDNEGLNHQFFHELRFTNGDGYPHLTVENVGVTFGAPTPNPNIGHLWLRVYDNELPPVLPDRSFSIDRRGAESAPGSWLPRTSTETFVQKAFYTANFERFSDPTFIPYGSALDIVNGVSRFAAPTIQPTDGPGYHDRVPVTIVEPLLTRLGYPEPPPAPLAVTITGPNSLASGATGTWTANVTGGSGVPTFSWQYWTNTCTDWVEPIATPPGTTGVRPGGGDPAPQGLPCGEWHPMYPGNGPTTSRQMMSEFEMGLRVTVIRGTETVTDEHTVVNSDYGAAIAGGTAAGGAGKTGTAAAVSATAPPMFSVEEPHPNPSRGAAALRFSLPEEARVRIVIYDVTGRGVIPPVEESLGAGWHEADLDTSALMPGVYIVRLEAGTHASTRRLTVIR